MATQYERAFSTARRTLTPERNALRLNSSRLVNVYGGDGTPERLTADLMTPRVLSEAQFVTALLGDVGIGRGGCRILPYPPPRKDLLD
jgi:hypothetical protein